MKKEDKKLLDPLLAEDGSERRYYVAELRADEEKGIIEGYAAVFNQWSEDLGFFRERIRPGAFSKTIREADIRALFNHDPNYVLGRNRSGTLDLLEDDHGLQFRVTPPEAQWAQDLYSSVKRGDIDQASFGFGTVRDEWNHDADPVERELIELRLYDVSVVTYPAYPQTSVSARTLGELFIANVQRTGNFEAGQEMLEQLENFFDILSTPSQEGHLGGTSGSNEADQALARAAARRRKLELLKIKK